MRSAAADSAPACWCLLRLPMWSTGTCNCDFVRGSTASAWFAVLSMRTSTHCAAHTCGCGCSHTVRGMLLFRHHAEKDTMQRKWCCETLGEGIRTVAAHAAPACCCAVCQWAHIAQVHARVGASLCAAACVCLECSLGACRGGLQSCTGLPALKGGCWCNMQCVHVFARDAHLVHVEAACNFALAPACTKGGCWWQCVHT